MRSKPSNMFPHEHLDPDGCDGSARDRNDAGCSPQASDQDSQRDSISTVSFSLPPSRFLSPAAKLAGAAGLGLLSAFLLSEMSKTPELKPNILALGGVGLLVAAVLLVFAVRDAASRLVVGQSGIAVGPWPFRQTVSWSQIVAWRMSLENDAPSPLRQLVLYIEGKALPMLINIGGLSMSDHRGLHKLMQMRLGDEG